MSRLETLSWFVMCEQWIYSIFGPPCKALFYGLHCFRRLCGSEVVCRYFPIFMVYPHMSVGFWSPSVSGKTFLHCLHAHVNTNCFHLWSLLHVVVVCAPVTFGDLIYTTCCHEVAKKWPNPFSISATFRIFTTVASMPDINSNFNSVLSPSCKKSLQWFKNCWQCKHRFHIFKIFVCCHPDIISAYSL